MLDGLKFRVMAERCEACLFTKDRLVSGERAAEIIKSCQAEGTHFICHKGTLAGNQNICCRAFYDTQDTMVIRLAKALNIVEFVSQEELKDV